MITHRIARGPLSLCFDLDGTLVDTAQDLVRVLDIVLGQAGVPPTDYRAARREIGLGSQVMISSALKRAGHVVSEVDMKAMRSEFLRLYADDIAQKSRPFKGVIPTLRGLIRRGHDLSVCTNKPGYLARPLLDALDMTQLFSVIIGGDDIVNNKPKADHIFACAGHTERARIVMIGDGSPDTLSAKAAGVPSVVMTYGYSTTPFYQLGGDIMLRQFSQLPSALHRLTVEL